MKIKVCFLVETTPNMSPYLSDAQYSMEEVLDKVSFYNQHSEISVGAVYYRDYNDIEHSFTIPFSTPEEFYENPANSVDVYGFSEDDTTNVACGLNALRQMDWEDADVKLIYHYAVSPAYGLRFHGPEARDKHPKGDPSGLDPLKIVNSLSLLTFNYTFFRITPAVDTMLSLFHEAYVGPGTFRVESFDTTESYISEPDSEEE